MSILRALAINSFLSFLFLFCFLKCTQTQFFRTTTTTTTLRPPYIRLSGLSLPLRNHHPPKCFREVPAVFFQYEKDVPIIGNSTIDPNFNVIEVCCQGFKRYEYDWSKCVPDCGNKCLSNGFCLDGGICQCFDEFVLNHRNNCVPTCPLGCPNGECYVNGTCICNRGYELDATKKYCVPLCDFIPCGHNEVCVSPYKCECADGYTRSMYTESKALGCQPVCIPECGYGRCVAPNECECFHGYQKRMNGFGVACEANCYMRCQNGFCVNTNTCLCQDGYKYDFNTSSCLPDCGDTCENGVCLSPGVCRCYNGYVQQKGKCVAVCQRKGGCGFYGKCIAPDVCGCAIVDGPLKSHQRCQFGNCSSRGNCRCQLGTTRFIDQCMLPDKVTTYASTRLRNLNITLGEEFNLIIGQYFKFHIDLYHYWEHRNHN